MKRFGKYFLAVILFLTLGFESSCHASIEGGDTLICLKVQGKFENAFHKDKKPYSVEVIKNGRVIDTVFATRLKKKFVYFFEYGNTYQLTISKAGFAPMLIIVDTKEMQDNKTLHRFSFETRLITEKRAKTFHEELLSMPVAIISYDPQKKKFGYDEAYTETLKTKMALNMRKK